MTAAEQLAAMDYDATDTPAVNDMPIDMRWPEPGDACLDVLATAQLYWPRTAP